MCHSTMYCVWDGHTQRSKSESEPLKSISLIPNEWNARLNIRMKNDAIFHYSFPTMQIL